MEVGSLYREPEVQDEIAWGALELRDVFRIYRSGPAETVALRGLDLRIEPRELVAVFGPSGSGKSTMLHLAGGGAVEPGRKVEHRALARAGRPEDRHQLSWLDPEVEAAQRDGLGRPGAVDPEDVAQLECSPRDLFPELGLAVEAAYLHRKLSIINR